MPPKDLQSVLQDCRKLVSNSAYRSEYLQSASKGSKGIIAYFSNYVPAEIIAAAGFHPLRIIGNFTHSDGHVLLHPACSFVQDVMAAARNSDFSNLRSLIFPNSCDSLKLLQQAMESDLPNFCCKTLMHPVNTDRSAISYFAKQLRHTAYELHSNFSEKEFKTVCAEYNSIRGKVRQLYELLQNNQLGFGYSDMIAVITAGLIMDRKEFTAILTQLIEHAQTSQIKASRKKVMLCGPLMDNYQLAYRIEKLGCNIVGDDITNGWRNCCSDIELDGGIFENIAEKILLSGPSPTRNYSDDSEFIRRAEKLKTNGVIFINQKFCEPHIHSYLARSKELEKLQIKSILIEIDHGQCGVQEADLLRVESFLELL